MTSFKAPKGVAKDFVAQPNLEPGTYPGRLVQIIDYGVQPQRPYQGVEKRPAHEIGLTYELVDEFMKDEEGVDIEDKPRWISEVFPFHPLSVENAKSTKRYLAFDPQNLEEGDFGKFLGSPVNVTIINNKSGDRVYDNVASLSGMRPRDAEKCAELVNPVTTFSLDAPDMEVFNKLPPWVREKIQGNLGYKGSKLEELAGASVPKEAAKAKAAPKAAAKPAVEEDDDAPY